MVDFVERPRLWQLGLLGFFTAVGFSGLLAAEVYGKAELWIAFGPATALLALVLVLVLWNYVARSWQDLDERGKWIESMTPYSIVLSKAAGLQEHQARVVPRMLYEAQVEAVLGAQLELGFTLTTPGGPVPYEWIAGYLRKCGYWQLYPVGRYGDKTAARAYAVALTEFLVMHRYVLPAAGNQSARWMSELSRGQFEEAVRLYELLAFSHGVNGKEGGKREGIGEGGGDE